MDAQETVTQIGLGGPIIEAQVIEQRLKAQGSTVSLFHPPTGRDSKRRCKWHEIPGDEHLEIVVPQSVIRIEVPPLCLGGDRHLGDLPSAGGSDQIDDQDPAALGQERGRIVGEFEVHAFGNPFPRSTVPIQEHRGAHPRWCWLVP